MGWIWGLALLAGAILVGIVAVRYGNPKKGKLASADAGAGKVISATKRWAKSHGYKVIGPVRLAGKGTFANLDALVVGYFGILGVKSYGYGGQVYGMPDEDKWLQVKENGERVYFKNPVDEAASDVRVIRDALFSAKLKNVPVEVVCVFSEPKLQMAVPRSVSYYTYSSFKGLLNKEKYTNDNGIDLDKTEQALLNAVAKG